MNEAVQNTANELADAIERAADVADGRAKLLRDHAKRIREHAASSVDLRVPLFNEAYTAIGILAKGYGPCTESSSRALGLMMVEVAKQETADAGSPAQVA